MINCFILEDEPLALEKIVNYLANVPFLRYVGSAASPLEITSEFTELNVQLVFSDILMPGMQGIEYLRALRHMHPTHPLPGFVFITADPDFAVESYALHVIDYLVKPYPFDRFYQACLKAAGTLRPGIPELADAAEAFIAVKVRHRYHIVYHRDIVYIEGNKDYVNIVTTKGTFVHHSTLKRLIGTLSRDTFIQTGQSYLINTDRIEDVGTLDIRMENGDLVKLGDNYRDAVYRHLKLPVKLRKGDNPQGDDGPPP